MLFKKIFKIFKIFKKIYKNKAMDAKCESVLIDFNYKHENSWIKNLKCALQSKTKYFDND